jgi:Raf kinase inhibitor-like YbhB/YbcL family protein
MERRAGSGTRSFVLTCIDTDVPSKADDVNKEGREIPADLPRVEFVHWLMANIPVECGELADGSCSDEITPHGKREPFGPPGSVQGVNSYTDWFAGDINMEGTYLGYDGPCPPWNDTIVHHYHFSLYALDTETLPVKPGFTLAELRSKRWKAMSGSCDRLPAHTVSIPACRPEANVAARMNVTIR